MVTDHLETRLPSLLKISGGGTYKGTDGNSDFCLNNCWYWKFLNFQFWFYFQSVGTVLYEVSGQKQLVTFTYWRWNGWKVQNRVHRCFGYLSRWELQTIPFSLYWTSAKLNSTGAAGGSGSSRLPLIIHRRYDLSNKKAQSKPQPWATGTISSEEIRNI